MDPSFPRLLVAVLLAAGLVACSASPARDDAATPEAGISPSTTAAVDPTRVLESGHDGSLALEHVTELAGEIGPRVAGTDGEDAAATYIAGYLTSLGYEVERMAFAFESERFRPADVESDGREVAATMLAGSGAGTVSGRAVHVGLGEAVDTQGIDLRGAVAITDRGGIRFAEKYENARAGGAVALIVINNEPGSFIGDLGVDAEMPVLGVAPEDAGPLLAATADGADVTVSATSGAVEALNVVARAPGTAICRLVVGGHYDTVPGAPGANDNASGTANVLELARSFAADGLDEGLCFVAFGAEESGLNGSEALVAEWEANGELPLYMVNLDVTGIGDSVELIAGGMIADRALGLIEQAGIPVELSRVAAGSSSDHASFEAAGVPTVYLTSGGFTTIHTPGDVVADIDGVELDRVGDAAYVVIADLLAEVARAG